MAIIGRAAPFAIIVCLMHVLAALLPVAYADTPQLRIDTVYDYKTLEKSKDTKGQAQTPDLVQQALAGDLADVKYIVFATRTKGRSHYYETFGHYFFEPDNNISPEGGRLIRLDVYTGKHEVLLEDLDGSLRDPCISYDGSKMLFSWLKAGQRYYQIYEMDIDGSNIRRITNAPFNDVEPIYLPDGDIVFTSGRAGRGVPCWETPIGLLHRCEADGSDIRMLSNGIEHEIRPWLLPDGRIIYNRWEYVNRSETKFHHLWTMNPDGTGSMTYFGNSVAGFAMTEARPIPGSDKVLCIFSPGHGRREREGYVTLLSPDKGPDNIGSALAVSQSAPIDGRNAPGVWRDPHPLSEQTYLTCCENGIYVMNRNGEYELLWRIPEEMTRKVKGRSELWVHEPMPIGPRPRPPVIADRVDYSSRTATLVLQDIRMGRSLDPRGAAQIERLLVMEVLPAPVSFDWRKDTVSVAGPNYNIKRILGTVPVQADGSAFLEVPPMRDIYFTALDAQGNNIKEMQSFVSLMPGENTGCVGCHEQRTRAPHKMPSLTLQALNLDPSRIQPLDQMPANGIMHFPRDIQPILTRRCASCHNWDKPSGGIVLSDDIGLGVHHSILSLARKDLLGKRRNEFLTKFTGGHHDVQARQEELNSLRTTPVIMYRTF